MVRHSHLPKYNGFLHPLFQALHDQIAVNNGSDRFSTIFIHPTPSGILGLQGTSQVGWPLNLWNRFNSFL
jgi:hypothetical protein